MNSATQEQIKVLLRDFLDGWIEKQYAELRRIEESGVSSAGILAPFHDALVPGIRGLGERGFSTALGNLHERIGLVIANSVHADARRAHDLTGKLPVLAREFITQRIDQLEAGASGPDHLYEREQLQSAFGGEVQAKTRIDLSIRTHAGEDHYFEIKSPKPNKGQCKEMKHRLLTAFGIRPGPDVHVWWAVPYNPYGAAAAYKHPYPSKFFDFTNEVKLAEEFWDFVGDEAGTYDELLELYRLVGIEYTARLDELRQAVAGRPV